MVCAWPEPPFASIAGVCDGMEALALVGAITETKSKLLRRGRIGRGKESAVRSTLPVLHALSGTSEPVPPGAMLQRQTQGALQSQKY